MDKADSAGSIGHHDGVAGADRCDAVLHPLILGAVVAAAVMAAIAHEYLVAALLAAIVAMVCDVFGTVRIVPEHERRRTWRAPCSLAVAAKAAVMPGAGYVYVVRFSTGTVKIGQTEDPYRRLLEHRRYAGLFNVAIVEYWISSPHANFLANEQRLISRCARVGPRAGREYFHAMDFSTAVRYAAGLSYLPRYTNASADEGGLV